MFLHRFLFNGKHIAKHLQLFSVLVFCLIFFTTCNQQEKRLPTQGDSVDTSAVLSSIDSLRSSYQKAVAAGDFKKLSSFITPNAIMVQAGSAEWDSTRSESQGPFPPGATIDIKPVEVQVMSSRWAYEMGNSSVTYTPGNSEQSRTLYDTYLVIFKRTSEGWKVHREVASSYIPQDSSKEYED